MKQVSITATALAALSLMAASAASAQLAPPVPTNAFITFGGLDWAWASPCRMSPDSCDPNYVIVDGFRFATAAEWALRPQASDFLDVAGNFEGDGGTMRCASAWFSSVYTNCDYNDVVVYNAYGSGPDNYVVDNPLMETWLVRGADGPNDVVPEPATMSLLATGLVGLGLKRRRRKS